MAGTKPNHRKPDRETYAVYVERTSMKNIDEMVKRGVFANRSHAVDAALTLLLQTYSHVLAGALREVETDGPPT